MEETKEVVATPAKTPEAVDTRSVEAAKEVAVEAIKMERERCSEIQTLVRKAGLEDSFAAELVKSDKTLEVAQREIMDKWAGAQKETISSKIEITKTERSKQTEACTEALLNKFDSRKYKAEDGNYFRNFDLVEMARHSVRANGENPDMMSKQDIVKRALHSTSDFPLILANVAGKTLRDAYNEESATFSNWTRSTTITDLKQVSRLALSESPDLDQVIEGGEYTDGSLVESREQYKLLKYGKIVSITEEAIINDDLDAFSRIPALLGAAARRKEGDIVYGILTANAALADGVALFHATHANLTDALLTVDGFGTARGLMRKQKGPQGLANLNLTPAYLIVGPDQEFAADRLVSPIQPALTTSVNPVLRNAPGVIVESRLSGNTYFLVASPSQIDTVETAYLAGQSSPTIETQKGFEVDGLRIKIKHFFAAKAIDFRGLVKSTNDAS